MGTNSARPDDLDAFAAGSREADHELDFARRVLVGALADFEAGCGWGSFNADSLMAGFANYVVANEGDAAWTANIANLFRIAGGDGALALPDAAIEASLRAADLDHDRAALAYSDAVAWGSPPTSGFADDPVNTAIGNFVEHETDLVGTGLAAGLTFVRTYNSRSDADGPFGPRWSSWASTSLTVGPDGAAYAGPDGQRALFPRVGAGFGRVSGVNALVERTEVGFALAWFDGARWDFDVAGRPTVVSAGPGTEIRFTHLDGRLVEIAHGRGRRVSVTWEGARIVGLSASDGRSVAYRYDERGHLVEAEGGAGPRRYAIDAAGLVASITDADGVVELVNTYDEHGRVCTQLSPFGRRTTFTYLPGNVTVTSDDSGGAPDTFLHDHAGRLVAAVDGHEQTLRKNYDDWGNPVAVIDRKGAVTVQEFDDRCRLVRRTAPNGSWFAFTHDHRDRLIAVVASTGAETRYRYTGAERVPSEVVDPEGGVYRIIVADGLVTEMTDPDGVVRRFEHDEHGDVVAVVDAEGATATIERDAAGHPVAVVTPSGLRTTFGYDVRGLVTERVEPDGAVWHYAYSAVGRPTAVVDPTGARTEVRYGDHGAAAELVDPFGAVTAHRYDPFGNLTGVTAPDGAKWDYGYDALSRVTTLTDPAGATWLREYDVEGNLVGSIDPTGIQYTAVIDLSGRVTGLDDGRTSSAFEFDELGRTLAHVRPDGSALRATYDACGRRITETDPDGGVTRYAYSPAGRLRQVTSPSGRTEHHTYDRCGRLVARVDGAGQRWTLRRDLDGRPVERTAPTGERESYSYDAAGRLAQVTAGRRTLRYAYDAAGRTTAVADATGATRRFGYDAGGRLVEAVDANGGGTRYAYDVRGNLATITDALGGHTTRTYDEVGRLVAETDPLGRTTTFAYDAAGHLLERTDATGAAVRWSHDASGRITTVRAGDGLEISIERDVLGRPVVLAEPHRRDQELSWDRSGRLVERRRGDLVLRWAYDADGFRREMSYPDGSRTAYERDGAGRTVALDHPLLGRVRVDRDPVGRLTGLHGDGLDAQWQYAAGELVGHEVRHGGSVRTTRLERDGAGRVTTAETDGRARRFGYDAGGRLVTASEPDGVRTYAYDAAGRLVRETGAVDRSYDYDAAGQLLGAGATRFGYDAAGRRVTESGPARERVYTWDQLGRLAGVATTSPDGAPRAVSVSVDALGELADVDGTAILWDTADPVAGLAWMGQSAVVGDGRPLAVVNAAAHAAGADPWLDADWRGSVGDGADPWGTAALDVGIGYRGELAFDGLVWLRNRAYDPATRGFLTPDPLPAVPGTAYAGNPYHYAGDDPVNLVDPLGLRPLSDAQMQAFRDQNHDGLLGGAARWLSDNADFVGHMALDLVGMVPVVGIVANGANAAWYAAEGDYVDAAMSAAAMIPVAGTAATAAKFGARGARALKDAGTAEKLGRDAEAVNGTARGVDRLDPEGTADALLRGRRAEAVSGELGESSVPASRTRITILGENMDDRVIPFADRSGARYVEPIPDDQWKALSFRDRYRQNDGQLRARIKEGDEFRYIGQDPTRPEELRTKFDLTRSELLRLEERGVPYDIVSPDEVLKTLGHP